MTHKMKLHPFYEVAEAASKLIVEGHAHIHQQFNCAHCGTKQTMAEPNKFFKSGTCEACGKITDIEKDGCNYMAHIALTDKGLETLDRKLREKK